MELFEARPAERADFDWKCVLKLECNVLFVKVIEVRFIVRPKATALLLSCSVCGPN